MFPGAILIGAPSMLLPPWLPFRFFLCAAAAQFLFWVMIGLGADGLATFSGGPGMVLGAVHMLTLGVFVSTAMGAASQLTPVATGLAPFSLLPHKITWWLHLGGTLLLVYGFATSSIWAMGLGGILESIALTAFAIVLGNLLWRTDLLEVPVRFASLSLLGLAGLLILGLVLILDFWNGLLGDHGRVAMGHLVLAAYGFLGLLIFGFSNILVPMFALSNAPPLGGARLSLVLAPLAIGVALAGIFMNQTLLTAVAVGLGVAAVGVHLHGMFWCLKNGQRKRLGLSSIMVKVSWIGLVAGLVLGGLLAFGLLGDRAPALFGFVLLVGWLLTFLTGILQRIVPFLAGMNMAGKKVKAPRLSQLGNEKLLPVHGACHGAAFLAVGAGIVLGQGMAVLGGAIIGTIGSLAFALYVIQVARSFRAHQIANHE